MSRSDSEPKATVRIEAALPTTQIEIFDATFRRLPLVANAGVVEQRLDPGVYKVFFGEAGASIATNVVVSAGEVAVVRQPEPLAFASPVPIPGTTTWRAWHETGVALAWSDPPLAHAAGEAEVFIFVRDLGCRGRDGRWPDRDQYEAGDPMSGLRLCSGSSDLVLDLGDPDSHWAAHSDHCAGARIRLTAGFWRLQASGGGGVTEMALIACKGWTTHAYFLAQRLPDGSFKIDMSQATLAMTRIGGAALDSWTSFRLRETALAAVRAGYPLRGPDPLRALCREFEDPLLGIVGAHFLLMEQREPDMDTFDDVVRRLEDFVGNGDPGGHPDILALHARSRLPKRSLRFSNPPLFSWTWRLMLRLARDHPEWIPPSSAVCTIAPAILHSNPWLMWSPRLAAWRAPRKAAWGISRPNPVVTKAARSSLAGSLRSTRDHPSSRGDADVELAQILERLVSHMSELDRDALARLDSRLALYLPVALPLLMAIRPDILEQHDPYERVLGADVAPC